MLKSAVSGEWYSCFDCKKCGEPIMVAPDPSNGQVKLKIKESSNSKVRVKCPVCQHQDDYDPRQLVSRMAPYRA